MPDENAYETVDLQIEERVAWLTLNRPDKLNALTPPTMTEQRGTFRSSDCAQPAPNAPVLAPITATGLFASAASPRGRDSQSTAFFSWPGTDALYSGVANTIASAPATVARICATAGGAGSTSSSSS